MVLVVLVMDWRAIVWDDRRGGREDIGGGGWSR